MRASPTYQPFTFRDGQSGFHAYPSDYVYSSFYHPYEFDNGTGADLYEFIPFSVNYLFRNFAFNQSEVDTEGNPTTGADGNIDNMWTIGTETYRFYAPTNVVSISALLSPSQSQWIYYPAFRPFPEGIGLEETGTNTVTLFDNATNFFGLEFLSAKIAYAGNPASFTNLYPIGWLPWPEDPFCPAYPEAAQPVLNTVGYYFCQPGIHLLPGHTNFITTNTSPPLIVGLGQPSRIAGFAKQAISNGDPSKFAYLGQYFEKAYRITNGVVTSRETGVLSPYGDFFPTEPGQVALVTMTNFGVNERGTAIVNVVSLAIDANHDGTMDTRINGPDFTSIRDPFAFWLNNDFDRGHVVDKTDFEEDDLPGGGSPVTGARSVTDCDYQWALGYYAIPWKRDLEDYTRLWVPGIAALYQAHTNLNFELSIRNNDSATGPAINIFQAVETNGGTLYLTDTNIANQQIAHTPAASLARLLPGSILHLNDLFLFAGRTNDYFIFCGARRGKGELVLQIKSGTNLLAETSAWIDLKDIKEMYERWTIGDIPRTDIVPTNVASLAPEDLPTGVTPFQYPYSASDTNTSYILHVHGWNLARWEKDRFAETAYKRLYWQGYQGRFGLFRWPTKYNFDGASWYDRTTDADNFDSSEWNAWRSSDGLNWLLNRLNTMYPGQVRMYGHSLGNVVAGEALKKATNGLLVSVYAAVQAAIPSHLYDPNTPIRSLGIQDSGTPNAYAHYWASNSPCYFNGIAGASAFVNFYNPVDYAVAGPWELNQNFKPDEGLGYHYSSGVFSCNVPVNGTPLTFPTDTYRLFAFCVEARCKALGAQTNVAGPFQTALEVNLTAPPYGYDNTHKSHSGEFRSNNMKRAPFWDTLLRRMQLKP